MQKLWKADLTFTSRFRKNRRTLFMHSPLEIARNYIEVGIHKVNLSIFKTILLGFFAGMFIGFAGIASTTASSTIGIASVAKLVGAAVFPAGMAMVLVAGSELFTGNNLIILAVLEKKVTVWKMLKNWLFVYIGNFIGAAFVAVLVVVGRTPDLFGEQLAQAIVNVAAARTNLSVGEAFVRGILCNILVCIAVWMSFAAKRVSGKLLAYLHRTPYSADTTAAEQEEIDIAEEY